MKQRIEDFIAQNRAAFDDREPPASAWKNIAATLPGGRSWWNSVAVWRAAAVVFMAVSAWLFVSGPGAGPAPGNEAALKEFRDVEAFYTQQMAEKVHLIDQFQKADGLNGFTQDFKQLEAMYMVLKEEMKTRPTKKVKDALVLNLLVRINLLNQQIHKLEQKYGHEKETAKGEDEARV